MNGGWWLVRVCVEDGKYLRSVTATSETYSPPVQSTVQSSLTLLCDRVAPFSSSLRVSGAMLWVCRVMSSVSPISLCLPSETSGGKEASSSTSPRRAVSPLLEVRRPHCTLNCDNCNSILEERFKHLSNNYLYSIAWMFVKSSLFYF